MLRKFVYPEVVYGKGARSMLCQYLKNIGIQKPLIVTDKGLIEAGWLKDLTGILDKSGDGYVVFSDVVINPTEKNVNDGVKVFKSKGCDGIVALGGGSPIDCGKAIGILATNPGSIFDYMGIDKIENPSPPIISMPTTAGSAADVSQFSIIRNTVKKTKYAIISKMIVSDVSLVDINYLSTLDDYQTIYTGLDTLSHAIESLLSTGSSRLTDLHSKEAIKLVTGNLKGCLNCNNNLEYREKVMYATMLAGFAFSNTSLGIIHAISHSLGGFTNHIHGFLNSCMLKPAIKLNYGKNERFEKLSEALGVNNDVDSIINSIDNILKSVNFRQVTLKDLGINENELDKIAKDALEDPCMVTNPKKVSAEDIKNIIRESFNEEKPAS